MGSVWHWIPAFAGMTGFHLPFATVPFAAMTNHNKHEVRADRRLLLRIAGATLSGVLLAWSQPPGGCSLIAWLALLPLLLALATCSRVEAVWLGLLTGMVAAWAMVGYWLLFAFHQVPLALWTSALLTQVTLCGSGIFGAGLFAWLCADWPKRRLATLWIPASWVAVELARASVVGGSPWCLLGHSQFSHPLLIQVADLTGVYGVSFVVASVSAAAAVALLCRQQRLGQLALTCAALTLTIAYGWWSLRTAAPLATSPATPPDSHFKVQAVHPAWPPGLGEVPERRLADLLRLTSEVAADRSALLVWPENSLRFPMQEGTSPLGEELTRFVQDRRQYLLAGLHRYERGEEGTRYYNSAALLAPEGSIVAVADKRILVPVAEARWRLLPSVEQPFDQGKPWEVIRAGRWRLGILLCFEAIFAEPARQLVAQGATLLVNPSNDELLTDGAAQFAAMSVFRAVENHVPLVHVSTTGISHIVDDYGRIVDAEAHAPRVLTASIGHTRTAALYTSIGDVFAGVCAAAVLLRLLWRRSIR